MNERKLYLKPAEAAERLGFSAATLANWRTKGFGPRYIKVGHKVLYPEEELDFFLNKFAPRSSTSEKIDD